MSSSHKLLEMPASLWAGVMEDLLTRGDGQRESGAFFLGTVVNAIRQVLRWIPYDDLDPGAFNKGFITLDTAAFAKLWDQCALTKLEVVADVHTHPRGPRQSPIDRSNPLIARSGHIALIVPNFAQGVVRPEGISVNVYAGGGRWQSYFGREAASRIHLV